MTDIAGEENFQQAKMPARAASPMADKSKGKLNPRMVNESKSHMNAAHHVPMVAPSHMAAKASPVDGLAKYAHMQSPTRAPVEGPNEMAAAGTKEGGKMGQEPRMRGQRGQAQSTAETVKRRD